MTKDLRYLVIDAVFASFSILLSIVGNITLPFCPFFKMDFSDIPPFVSSFLFSPVHGFIILFVTSFIRVIFFDVHHILGFLLRMSSAVIILMIKLYNKSKKHLLLYSTIFIAVLTMIRLPISYLMWTHYYSVSKEIYVQKMLPNIVILISLRTSLNIFISSIISKHVQKYKILLF